MSDPGLAPLLLTLDETAAAQPTIIQSFVLMAVIVGIMYLVLYLPQQRERKKQEQLLAGIKRDDRVITSSGIHGRVVSVGDRSVVLEIAERTQVTFEKSAIGTVVGLEAADAAASSKKKSS